jgi:hypothetical protein
MYVKDIDSIRLLRDIEADLLKMDQQGGYCSQTIAWDLEDVRGRISELTDWY